MSENDSPPDSEKSTTQSLKGKMVSGSIWMMSMRWSMRLLGIINVGILARLLEKEDFGLVAMVTAILALPLALLDMGFETSLIQNREAGKDHYNTAWTLRVIQMSIVAAVIYLSAPYIADYYNDARVAQICRVLALSVFLQGLQNIWVVSFVKGFRFHVDFMYNLAKKLMTTIATIIFAFWLRSYWALVYGQIAGATINLVLSLIVTSQLPRPTLKEWRRIWNFARWNMMGSIAQYLYYNSDKLILGRFVPASLVGIFSIGREISDLPIREISAPLNRALGPGFAELRPNPERYAAAIRKTWGAVATIVLPISIGIAASAQQIVPVLLGPGWEQAIPIIQLLALSGILGTLDGILINVLLMSGFVAYSAFRSWIRAGVLLVAAVPAVIYFGVLGMAFVQLMASGSGLIPSLRYIARKTPGLTVGSVLTGAIRPACAVVVMGGCVLAWDLSTLQSPLLLLACKVATGAAVYCLVLLGLWHAGGRPDTIERTVLSLLGSTWRRVAVLNRPS